MLTLTLVMRMSLRSKDRWGLRGEQALEAQLTEWWVLKEVEVADEVVLEVSHSPGAMAKFSWRRGPWCKSLKLALGR